MLKARNMINWKTQLECDYGTVRYNPDGDHQTANGEQVKDVHVTPINEDCSIGYWAYENGLAVSGALSDLFNVRNAISRKDKILNEVVNLMRGGECTIAGNCPELMKLLDQLVE